MTRVSVTTTLIALAAFLASSVVYALSLAGFGLSANVAEVSGPLSLSLMQSGVAARDLAWSQDVTRFFVQPNNFVLWTLLVIVWGSLAAYGFEMLRRAQMVPARPKWAERLPAPAVDPVAPADPADHQPTELAPIAAALMAGALWPWLTTSHPVMAFLLTIAMMLAALTALIRGQREGQKLRFHRSVAIFAGWATAVSYASFASILSVNLGMSPGFAATIAMVLCASVGMVVQAQIGHGTSYSIALIWALVGLAIAAMETQPNVAIAAVIGITAMIIMLVRAAS